jgi:hypothetical protein
MGTLSTDAKNQALDALDVAYLSLHHTYSTVGANEVVGGSYARVPVILDAAIDGVRGISTTYTFDVPAGPFVWLGLWSTGGTFQGMTPLGSPSPRQFTISTASTFSMFSHGFVVDDTFVLWGPSLTSLPSPLTEGTIYYVVSVLSDNEFQASDSLGGTVLTFGLGNGHVQRCTPQVFDEAGTFTVDALTLDANLVF